MRDAALSSEVETGARGMIVDSEHSKRGLIYWFWGMSMVSKDEVNFLARVASMSCRYRVIRNHGKWITTGEEPLTYF